LESGIWTPALRSSSAVASAAHGGGPLAKLVCSVGRAAEGLNRNQRVRLIYKMLFAEDCSCISGISAGKVSIELMVSGAA